MTDSDTGKVVRRLWHDFYIAELERFYRVHIEDLATELAVDQAAASGGSVGAVAAACVAYWHFRSVGPLSHVCG